MRRLMMVLGGLLVGLLVGEVTVRILVRHTRFMRMPIHAAMGPRMQEAEDSLMGWELIPGLELDVPTQQLNLTISSYGCWVEEEEIVRPVRINSRGFRGPEWDDTPAAGVTRIAMVGDSHIFGEGLLEEEIFSTRLGAHLGERYPDRTFEVLNLGVSGYNTEQELQVVRRRALPADPDVVLVGYCTNDPQMDKAAVFFYPVTANPLSRSVLFKLIRFSIETRLRQPAPQDPGGRVDPLRELARLHVGEGIETSKSLLRTMARECRSEGVGFGIVIMPDLLGDTLIGADDDPYLPMYATIESLRDDGIPVVQPYRKLATVDCPRSEFKVSRNDWHAGSWLTDWLAEQTAASAEMEALLGDAP